LGNKPYTGGAQMLKIEFSEADVKALRYERYYHPHPRVQRKMEAIYLKSQRLPSQQICHLSGITANTLRSSCATIKGTAYGNAV
jgi:hypothetical protein